MHTLSSEPVQYSLFTRVFGGVDSPSQRKKLERSSNDLLVPVGKLFLNETAAAAAVEAANVPERVASFVTFAPDAGNLKRWEKSADVRLLTQDLPGQHGKVEANLQSLVRDFGACMSIPILYGKDFLDRNPRLLDDFWKFDNNLFPLLMIGVPTWAPIRMVREGKKARARLLTEMEALSRRIDQAQKGVPVDSDIDMSDVSSVAFGRSKVYEREGWTFAERAAGEFALLWGQNANTHPVLFWFLLYVYSTPGILARLRSAIAPFFKLSDTQPREIISMDHSGLARNCHLLKACIFETYRMVNEPTSIRYVVRPITINEGNLAHTLKADTFVSAPHSLINYDPTIFADPDKFIPDRFLETDPKSGEQSARYGRLKPWGSGASICKGRTFAEREIVSLGAAILSLWDIEPVGGTWTFPAMVPGTGVKKPVQDIRVTISRRVD
jgi:cytochrome P450